jgi:hypothetical protein
MNTARSPLPTSLHTATPAEGQELACRLAQSLSTALPPRNSMPELLSTGSVSPAPEIVAAIYFHAIAIANAGWRDPARIHA